MRFDKDDTDTETTFDRAVPPRGQEEPLSAAADVAADKPAHAQAKRLDHVIDIWFADCIRGGAIGRHTDSYNHLQRALVELKRRLDEYLNRED
ncbi:MAG: hypothetical protein KGL35_14870 [Bradyrhizobium sp.]|nr:hypothetical protein [Bradyrhizobium sp.]